MISFLEKWFDNKNQSYDAKISERVQTLFLKQYVYSAYKFCNAENSVLDSLACSFQNLAVSNFLPSSFP